MTASGEEVSGKRCWRVCEGMKYFRMDHIDGGAIRVRGV